MYMNYTLFYAFVFSSFFDLSRSIKTKHRRAHELRNEIYVPSIIDFEFKGKSLAWFPVHIKNGAIKSVGKLRWKNRNRKCRYVEESDCLQTGPPKRIYNAQEDRDDPDSGKGEDDGGTAYDDYDYYDDDNDDDENSTSKGDPMEYDTSASVSKDIIGTDTVADSSQITVDDLTLFIEDDVVPKYTTENPLTDETEEQTERKVPGSFRRGHCRNRYHTYQDQYLDMTTSLDITTPLNTTSAPDTATRSDLGTGSSEYNEQSVHTTRNGTTTSIKIKYYTDAYDEEETEKVGNDVEITKSTTDGLVSIYGETPKVQPVTDKSEIYELSTMSTSSSVGSRIGITVSEGPETYHSETKPERLDTLSSLQDYSTISGGGSVSNRPKPTSVTMPTYVIPCASKTDDFTEDQTECSGDYCFDDVTDNINKQSINNCATDERLRHIETPPYPKLPVDLRFPTCAHEDRLDDILSPTFAPCKTSEKNKGPSSHRPSEMNSENSFSASATTDSVKNSENISEKKLEKKKEKSRKNRKHCRRKSTYLNTEMMKYTNTLSNVITERYVAKQLAGNEQDPKVVVRIPPSLSDIPVVVVRDPLTQKLSLSLIGAEKDSIRPKQIYFKPFLYNRMFPPPFSYNNIYSPNIPPYNKIYPYEYLYGPHVGYRYDKPNYVFPKRLRYYNNYRWVRDSYEDDDEDDEEDDKNSTNSDWEIYLTV